MDTKHRVARLLVSRLSREEVVEIAGEILADWLAEMSGEEKVAFLQKLVEDNLGLVLKGLSREEKAQLMNALLPLMARELPLMDIDILGAFSSMGEDDKNW